ncbi:MAG: HRDC domain-containing protein [Bacteroidaceae bacterium]|nr:HRDC domain-containing protein [Bacteroidaceae bacterium]
MMLRYEERRDIPHRDWHDYLLQLLQMRFIEIAYNEDRHIHVTDLGKEVLYGKRTVQLAVVNREDFSVKARRKRVQEKQRIATVSIAQDENKELFEKLRQIRKRIADENHWPAYVVMSDRSLHALAIERHTTLQAFGNVFGIGEHKRDTYGLEFLAVIREYASGKEDLPFPEAGIDTAPTPKPISHMEQQKQLHAKAYAPWTEEEDGKLGQYYSEGLSVSEIASKMERNNGAIYSRIKKLDLNIISGVR